MYWNDTLNLLTVVNGVDGNGFPLTTETSKTIYCNVKSIRQQEFYNAMQAGIKLEYTFVVRAEEYENQELIQYNSKIYKVERTYKAGMDNLEIIVSDLKTGVDT